MHTVNMQYVGPDYGDFMRFISLKDCRIRNTWMKVAMKNVMPMMIPIAVSTL